MVLVMLGSSVYGCDMCSCYIGIQPNYNLNQLSFRYRISSVEGWHQHSIEHESGEHEHSFEYSKSKEMFHTYEMMLRHYIHPKWQLIVNLSLAQNIEISGENKMQAMTGLKDPIALIRHQIFSSLSTDTLKMQHRMFFGGGLRLPFGPYDFTKKKHKYVDPTFMPGSGSLDLLLSTTYMIAWQKLGFQADIMYTANSRNRVGYLFGNEFNANGNFSYDIKLRNFNILPIIGGYYEAGQRDNWYDAEVENSGGNVLFSNYSILINKENLGINFIYQIPISQNKNGSQGIEKNRLMTSFTLNF
jgi:hypothetical protein